MLQLLLNGVAVCNRPCSYKTIAYTEQFNQTENFTLYSFIDLANDGRSEYRLTSHISYTEGLGLNEYARLRNAAVPLPTNGETSQEYLFSLNDTCHFGDTSDSYGTIVSSVQPTITSAFTKRWAMPEPTVLPAGL